MSEAIDLKAVKTKIYRVILEDGLLEIMMGISLILSGIYLFNKSMILNYLWLPIALVLIEVIRRRFIYPRAGYAKISLPPIEIITVLGTILIGFSILAALMALIAAIMGHPVEENWQEILLYALIFLLVISFCFIAHRFSAPRWYMHGISMGIVFLLGKALDAHGLVLGLGIWITLVGLYVFLRFVKQFPIKPNQNSDHDPQSQSRR